MKYPLPLLAALLVSAGAFSHSGCSKAKPEPPPSAEDQPIAIPPKPYTSRDFQRQQDAWYARNMVYPFLSPIPESAPWKPAARAYLPKALAAWQTQHGFKPVAESGKALIAMGCDDPMIAFLVQYFRCYSGDREGVAEAAKAAFERLDRGKQYSPAVARMAGLAAGDILQVTTGGRSPEIDRRVVELTRETLLARNYAGRDDCLFLRHTLAVPWGSKHFLANYEDVADACVQGRAPEWVRHTLKGSMEIKRAWNRNGVRIPRADAPGSAFSERYSIARDEFTAAWRLRPDRPDAAAEMIGVTMQGHGNDGDTMRLWFDRAVAAQFDYLPAYDAFYYGQIPPLGGSVPGMLQFGKICAQTRQFDTEVPQQFFKVLEKMGEHTDWRKIYHNSILSPLVVPTALGLAEAPTRRADWKRLYSLAAVQTYLAGDGAAAIAALNQAGGGLSPEGYELLYLHSGDYDVMKREIAILGSPAGKTFWSGEQLYDEGKLDEACAAFEKCAAVLQSSAPELASATMARSQALRLEKAIAAGGWVKIPLDAGSWRFQGGDWKATDNGCLEITGNTENGMALAAPCVGNRYEVRGEIEVDSPARDEAVAGVLLGEHGTASYVVCWFKQLPSAASLKASATGGWNERTGKQVDVPPTTPNSFLIHVENGKANFQLNGVTVATRFHSPGNPLHWGNSRMGLAVRGLHPGTTIRVRNLEVQTLFK